MSYKFIPAIFVAYLASSPVQAAPLPAPVQVLLQQIKGEWVVLDQNTLSTRLSLKADGSGELTNYDGSSPISWRLNAGAIHIKLLQPTTTSWTEYENDQEYLKVTALKEVTLEYKKLEGLGSIIWKMTSQSQVTYPDHPEKSPEDVTTVRESSKLVAARQFKKFAPKEGQILTLDLPSYSYTDDSGDVEATVSVLARLDAANVLTLIRGQEIGQNSLYWTIDNGSLRVSDGKGYTVSYRLYKGDDVSAQLLADVQRPDRHFIADQSAVYSNETLRTEGFRADSPLFQGCWNAFEPQTNYCFQRNRQFTFTAQDADAGTYSSHGLWRLENGRIIVDRYREINGMLLADNTALLNCEKELADSTIVEKSCQLYQTRSYELINQNASSIGVYRILKHDDFTAYDAHVFKRSE